jgi:hypothetical protein
MDVRSCSQRGGSDQLVACVCHRCVRNAKPLSPGVAPIRRDAEHLLDESQPSTADMVAKLRRVLIAARFRAPSP